MIFLLRRLVVLAVLFALAALVRAAGRARGRDRVNPKRHCSEGAMVRDRICNTFLPRTRALVIERDGRSHFFCSETCRRTFLEGGKGERQSA